jgi:hypothetical protein
MSDEKGTADSPHGQVAAPVERSRREVLRTTAAGTLGAGVAGVAAGERSTGDRIRVTGEPSAHDGTASPEGSVTFEDQTSEGREVVVAEIETSIDARYTLATDGHETTFAQGELPAGEYEDHALTLDRRLTGDRLLEFTLYPAGGGEAYAIDSAEVELDDSVSYTEGMAVTRVDADPDAGFNYPYFLYVPSVRTSEASGPILVEPNNTGTGSDDFALHRERARRLAEGEWNGGSGRTLADRLGVPFLVPAFPRPESDPVDWRHYVHQLDTDTMRIESGDLSRVDLQLLRMAEHARERVADSEYTVEEGLLLNGFSASGNFVNRFAALHPQEVISVTAGGINGMAVLPRETAKGHDLNYQVGIADLEDLTGEPFDAEAFRDVNQFLYMGALDWSDTIPYGDAWSEAQREVALDVMGPNMQRDRMPYCKSVYEAEDVSAAFKIYEREGHTPTPAIDDMVAFHEASMAGESIERFGGNVGDGSGGEGAPPDPAFTVDPGTPQAGETVAFDASETTATGEIVAYTWTFGDGGTGAGVDPAHTFESAADYTVELVVVDGDGRTGATTVDVTVEPGPTPTATATQSRDGPETDPNRTATNGDESRPGETATNRNESGLDGTPTDSDEPGSDGAGAPTTDGNGPGFGASASLTGVGVLAYALWRRLGGDERRE